MNKYIEISKVNEYGITLSEKDLEHAEHLKTQYKIFEPFGELVPLVYLRYYDKKYNYYDLIIALKYNNTFIQPILSSKHKKYYFRLVNSYSHKHLQYYKSKLDVPNYIGTPTAKKLEDWFYYLTMDECYKKECVRLHLEKEDALKDELKKLGSLVQWKNDNNTAIIEKNNLRYSIFFNAGVITKNVVIIEQYKVELNDFLIMLNYIPENKNENEQQREL